MCWVDMQLLYSAINAAVRQSCSSTLISPHTHEPFTDTDRVKVLQ